MSDGTTIIKMHVYIALVFYTFHPGYIFKSSREAELGKSGMLISDAWQLSIPSGGSCVQVGNVNFRCVHTAYHCSSVTILAQALRDTSTCACDSV